MILDPVGGGIVSGGANREIGVPGVGLSRAVGPLLRMSALRTLVVVLLSWPRKFFRTAISVQVHKNAFS